MDEPGRVPDDAPIGPTTLTALAGDGAVPKAVETALRNLGYSSQEARLGLEAVDWKLAPSTQDALAEALKALGRK